MKIFKVVGLLLLGLASVQCMAEDLTAAKAEALLAPVMGKDCGNYYTTQGEPDFADLENKAMCTYRPRVTRLVTLGPTSAGVEYNHDRVFDNDMSVAWLKDYAKMEAHEAPSLMFRTLKNHLDNWRATSHSVDQGPRPGKATFKLVSGGWQVDQAPQ